jgi:hypothetical protein
VVPSRDSLQLSDVTRDGITAAIDRVVAEFVKVATAQVAAAPTLWQAAVMCRNLEYCSRVANVFGEITVTWNGVKVSSQSEYAIPVLEFRKKDKTLSATRFSIEGGRESTIRTEKLTATDGVQLFPVPENFGELTKLSHFIVINDAGTEGTRLAHALIGEKLFNRSRSAQRRKLSHGHMKGQVTLLDTKLSANEVSEVMGGAPVGDVILYASSLKKTLPKTAIRTVVKDPIYRRVAHTPSHIDRWEARVNMPDDSESRYYVPLTTGDNGRAYTSLTIGRYVHIARTLWDVKVDVVYGIKETEVSRVTGNPNWINLVELVNGKVAKWISDNSELLSGVHIEPTPTYPSIREFIGKTDTKDVKALPLLAEYSALLGKMSAVRPSSEQWILIQSITNQQDDLAKKVKACTKDVKALSHLEKKLFAKYPMFQVALQVGYRGHGEVWNASHIATTLDYMKSIG